MKVLNTDVTVLHYSLPVHTFSQKRHVTVLHYMLVPILTHQWPYEFNKPQWPYHGLSDHVFSRAFYTWMSVTIPRSHRLGLKKPGLWDRGMVTGGPGQKHDWKIMAPSVRQWYGHWRVKNTSHKFWKHFNKIWRFWINLLEISKKHREILEIVRNSADINTVFEKLRRYFGEISEKTYSVS